MRLIADRSACRWVWKKWGGPKQYVDKKTGSIMMLPYVHSRLSLDVIADYFCSTDFSLVQDKKFKDWVVKYAKDEDLFFKE